MVHVDVICKFEVLDSNGELTIATTTSGSNTAKTLETNQSSNMVTSATAKTFQVINAVRQWGDLQPIQMGQYGVTSGSTSVSNYKMLTTAPNDSTDGSVADLPDIYKKNIRFTDQAEFLYFFMNEI